jgi:MFS family permease
VFSNQEMSMVEEKKLSRGQWAVLVAAFLGWMFDGMEMGLSPIVARSALQDLLQVDDVGRWHGGIMACFLLGAAGGGLAFGWLGDKVGRVKAMVCSVLTYSIFIGCGYFATHPVQLGAFLFVSALGMGGQWSLGVSLVMECWPERHRPKLAGLIGAAANFGFLFIAVVALFKQVTVHDWRWMMLVGASPAVLALFILFFVPESERWKASVRKTGRSPIVEIFTPPLLRKTLLAMCISAIPLVGTWAAVSAYIPAWAEQKQEEQIGKTMLPQHVMEEYAAAKTPSERTNVLKKSLDADHWKQLRSGASRSKAWVQIVISIGAILGCFIAPLAGNIYGRRMIYFSLCLLSLISCQGLFYLIRQYNLMFICATGVVGLITASFYGLLPLYLPELFPTRVRATGQGLSFNCGRVLAAFGTIFTGQLVSLFGNDYGRAMGYITLVYILGLAVIWLGPETKGKPLPE